MIAALLALALAQGTATVKPADVSIPDPWRPSDQSPLPNDEFRDCKSGEPATEGLVRAVVEIDPTEVRFAGRRIAPHAGGELPGHLIDPKRLHLIPLTDRLERTRRDLEALAEQGCLLAEEGIGAGRLVFAIDGRVPFGVVGVAQKSAFEAGFRGADFLVGGEARAVEVAPLKDRPTPSVVVHGGGYRVFLGAADPVEVPGHDARALRAALGSVVDDAGGPMALVVPVDDVPWSAVADALQSMAFDQGGEPFLSHVSLGRAVRQVTDAPGHTLEGRPGMPTLGVRGGTVLRTGLPSIGATADGNHMLLGALDRPLIDATIKAEMDENQACYQRGLGRDPKLAGELAVRFVVDKTGQVSSAEVKRTSLDDAETVQCILGRFENLVFEEPKGNGIVIITYPFVFKPQ